MVQFAALVVSPLCTSAVGRGSVAECGAGARGPECLRPRVWLLCTFQLSLVLLLCCSVLEHRLFCSCVSVPLLGPVCRCVDGCCYVRCVVG